MTNDLASRDATFVITKLTPEQKELIRRTVAPDSTDDELMLFMHNCERIGVHPMDKLVHFTKRKVKDGPAKIALITSIDLFRSFANDSAEYDGQDEPEYEYGDDKKKPVLARVRVYKQGIERAFVGVARWSEYCPGPGLDFMWQKMPHAMLGKCAEALAIRKAFPRKLHELYIKEELEQQAGAIEGEVVEPSRSRVASVQPAEQATTTHTKGKAALKAAAPAQGAEEKKSAKEALVAELAAYCGPNPELQAQVLKAVSFCQRDGKDFFITSIQDCPSERWLGASLGKLRDRVKNGVPPASVDGKRQPDGCTLDPETCPHSNFESIEGSDKLRALCTEKGNKGVCQPAEAQAQGNLL